MTRPTDLDLPPAGLASEILAAHDGANGRARADAVLQLADTLNADARAAAPADTGGERHVVVFTLADEDYAIDIDRVREILRVGTITRLPGAPRHVRGITNVRGRIVPVVDLRERLALPAGEPTARARVLLVELRGRVIGALVDAVTQVLRFPASAVCAPPDEVGAAHAEQVVGVAQLAERLVVLLDVDRTVLGERAPARNP